MNEYNNITICYWQTQALYETTTLGVDRKHWQECLICDGKPPSALEKKPMYLSVNNLSKKDILDRQFKGYQIKGAIKTPLVLLDERLELSDKLIKDL